MWNLKLYRYTLKSQRNELNFVLLNTSYHLCFRVFFLN